jgi:hypothetical protein
MQDVRQHPRAAYRLAVDLYCGEDETWHHCHTANIGRGGLFAIGVLCLRPGDNVRVSLGRRQRGALQLHSQVARVSQVGAGLAFGGNGQAKMEMLAELLSPDWDGENLLEGVIKIGPWYRDEDLAGWMRMTSMLSDWQRLTQIARREFLRSVRADSTTSRPRP